jgi:hypothetical protein
MGPPYYTGHPLRLAANQNELVQFSAICPDFVGIASSRLHLLRNCLQNIRLYPQFRLQERNMRYLVRYYEDGGKVPVGSGEMWLRDGKEIDRLPRDLNSQSSPIWIEKARLS